MMVHVYSCNIYIDMNRSGIAFTTVYVTGPSLDGVLIVSLSDADGDGNGWYYSAGDFSINIRLISIHQAPSYGQWSNLFSNRLLWIC